MKQKFINYGIQIKKIDEDFFEQCVVEHLREHLGWEHLYEPSVDNVEIE